MAPNHLCLFFQWKNWPFQKMAAVHVGSALDLNHFHIMWPHHHEGYRAHVNMFPITPPYVPTSRYKWLHLRKFHFSTGNSPFLGGVMHTYECTSPEPFSYRVTPPTRGFMPPCVVFPNTSPCDATSRYKWLQTTEFVGKLWKEQKVQFWTRECWISFAPFPAAYCPISLQCDTIQKTHWVISRHLVYCCY